MGEAKSQASQRLLAALDAELEAASKAAGADLIWSAAEEQIRELLADAVDRRDELNRRYKSIEMLSLRLKVASEIRLLDAAIPKLLAQLSTEIEQPMSVVSQKASKAANARWTRERMKRAAGNG
jgi:hypothetical protein